MSFRVELSLCIICRGLQKCFGAGGRIMQMSITCTGILLTAPCTSTPKARQSLCFQGLRLSILLFIRSFEEAVV